MNCNTSEDEHVISQSGGGDLKYVALYRNVDITGTPTFDSEYVTETQNGSSHTYTFKKACSGLIGANDQLLSGGSVTGTITLQMVPNSSGTYVETFWKFSAKAGQTVTFTRGNYSWLGYEIVVDQGGGQSGGSGNLDTGVITSSDWTSLGVNGTAKVTLGYKPSLIFWNSIGNATYKIAWTYDASASTTRYYGGQGSWSPGSNGAEIGTTTQIWGGLKSVDDDGFTLDDYTDGYTNVIVWYAMP